MSEFLGTTPIVARIIVLSQAEIDAPTAAVLADYSATYMLDEAPYTRYVSTGSALITTGAGSMANDILWNNVGDLAVGAGTDAAVVLPMGTALQVLRTNSTVSGLEWANPSALANDALWDAAGDLAIGTGANTAAKLPIGSAGQITSTPVGRPSNGQRRPAARWRPIRCGTRWATWP